MKSLLSIFCVMTFGVIFAQTIPYNDDLNGLYVNLQEAVVDEMIINPVEGGEADFLVNSYFWYTENEETVEESAEGLAYYSSEIDAYELYWEGKEEPVIVWFESRDDQLTFIMQFDPELDLVAYTFVPEEDTETYEEESQPEIASAFFQLNWEKYATCFVSPEGNTLRKIETESGFYAISEESIDMDGETINITEYIESLDGKEGELSVNYWSDVNGDVLFMLYDISVDKEILTIGGVEYKKAKCD